MSGRNGSPLQLVGLVAGCGLAFAALLLTLRPADLPSQVPRVEEGTADEMSLLKENVSGEGGGAGTSEDGEPSRNVGKDDASTNSMLSPASDRSASLIEPPVDWTLQEKTSEGASTRWLFRANRELEDCARDVLLALRDQGGELKSAGYLDLFGDVWGCAYALPDMVGSLLVTVSLDEKDVRQGTCIDVLEISAARARQEAA